MTDPIQKCPACGQRVNRRKVTFSRAHSMALWKAYKYCISRNVQVVQIQDLNLTHTEYANMNNLVRFGLAFKHDGMKNGEYGIPRRRAWEFFENRWPVAAYYWRDPVTEENIMAEERIFFYEVPSIQKVMDEFGEKMTEYAFNPSIHTDEPVFGPV